MKAVLLVILGASMVMAQNIDETGPRTLPTIAAPANPPAGSIRVYASSATGKLACLDSTGADCLPAGGAGTANPTVTFTNATSVTFTHNLNTETPIIQCYDASAARRQFFVETITSTSVNVSTIEFLTPVSGRCVANATGGGSGGGGSGTVTSVAMTVPAEFSVSGSPVTSFGTLAVSKVNQNANLVYAGPASGGAGAPTFRALTAADLPGGTSANAWVTVTVAGLDIPVLTAGACETSDRTTNVAGIVTGWGIEIRLPWEANKSTKLHANAEVSTPGVVSWRVCNDSQDTVDLTVGNFTVHGKPPIL